MPFDVAPSDFDKPNLSGVFRHSAEVERLSGPEVVAHGMFLVIVKISHIVQLKERKKSP